MNKLRKIIAIALVASVLGTAGVSASATSIEAGETSHAVVSIKNSDAEVKTKTIATESNEIIISEDSITIDGEKDEKSYDMYILKGDYSSDLKIVIDSETKRDINIQLEEFTLDKTNEEALISSDATCNINLVLAGIGSTIKSSAEKATALISAPNASLNIQPDVYRGHNSILSVISTSEAIDEDTSVGCLAVKKLTFVAGAKVNFESKANSAIISDAVTVNPDVEIRLNVACSRKIITNDYKQQGGGVFFGHENTGSLIYLTYIKETNSFANFRVIDGHLEGSTDGYCVEGDVINQASIIGGTIRLESSSKPVFYARRKFQDFFINGGIVELLTSAAHTVECNTTEFIKFSNSHAVILNDGNTHITCTEYPFAKKTPNGHFEKVDPYNLLGQKVYQHHIDLESIRLSLRYFNLVEVLKNNDYNLGHVLYNDVLVSTKDKFDLGGEGPYIWLSEPQKGDNGALIFTNIGLTFKHVGAFSDYIENIDTVPAEMAYDNSSLFVFFDKRNGINGTDSVTQITDYKLPAKIDVPEKDEIYDDKFLGYYDSTDWTKKYYDENGNLVADADIRENTFLVAQWQTDVKVEAERMDVHFVLNGGTCDFHSNFMDNDFNSTIPLKEDFVIPDAVKEGKTFLGWYLSPDGSGERILNSAMLIDLLGTENVTLYAIWEGETYTKAMYGDANCDGFVNMEDVTTIQKVIAELITPEKAGDNYAINSDVTHDEKTTMEDVVLIQRYLAKLVDSLD
ncbi:MAG: InlB B-repeat-containing protein [Clostridia bacterium]|nr:InlB B-repeat-containing protein [Clostridia bacterium]